MTAILRLVRRYEPVLGFGKDGQRRTEVFFPILRCSCGTHFPAPPPAKRWYLNTGTWMHKYALERKRLVREPLEYSFVRVIDTHRVLAADYGLLDIEPVAQLLRWNDAVGKFEVCETFEGTDER
jgi:hypothetical protein